MRAVATLLRVILALSAVACNGVQNGSPSAQGSTVDSLVGKTKPEQSSPNSPSSSAPADSALVVTQVPGPPSTPTAIPQPAGESELEKSGPPTFLSERIPWLERPPDSLHIRAGKLIVEAWEKYPDAVIALAEIPWVVDGILGTEWDALKAMVPNAAVDAGLIQLVSEWPWVGHRMNEYEISLLSDSYSGIASRDAEMAKRIAAHHWTQPGANAEDHFTLVRILTDLANEDLVNARRVSTFPWFTDGLTYDEVSIVEEVAGGKEIAKCRKKF